MRIDPAATEQFVATLFTLCLLFLLALILSFEATARLDDARGQDSARLSVQFRTHLSILKPRLSLRRLRADCSSFHLRTGNPKKCPSPEGTGREGRPTNAMAPF